MDIWAFLIKVPEGAGIATLEGTMLEARGADSVSPQCMVAFGFGYAASACLGGRLV